MASNSNTLKLGVAVMDAMNDDIYDYKSTLFKTQTTIKDSLLQIMFQYRNRWYKYLLLILQTILNVANNDPEGAIYRYLKNIEPPTYSYSRYIDWIKPYLKERVENCVANSGIGSYK